MNQIAILEDELIIAKDIEEVLKKLGYNIVGVFISGNELLEKIKNGLNMSLVLSDINLGSEPDGIEVGKKLFELGIPTIFISAYTDESTFAKALSFPVFGFLKKPLEHFSLKSAIEIALNNFKYFLELKEKIKQSEKEYATLLKKIENKEKQLLEEEKLRENLLVEKNKLSKEISSFEYYAQLLKNEIEKALIEKERILDTKNEIFNHLNVYAKGMEFFNQLFCGILDRDEDFMKIMQNVVDNFLTVIGENCKGIKITLNEITIYSTNCINTPFVYKVDFNARNIGTDIFLYFNTEENLKKDITKSTIYLIDVFLKLVACFYSTRKLFNNERKEKEFYKSIFELLPFPLIYRSEDKTILNNMAKEFFNILRDKDIKKILLTDEKKLKEDIIENILKQKKSFLEYTCKFKSSDGIIKEVRARRFLIEENIKEYIDIMLP
ncbi:MAG: response regulator [Brevinematales bacterium]|nr:response regulator [Brevinematales bacterium]